LTNYFLILIKGLITRKCNFEVIISKIVMLKTIIHSYKVKMKEGGQEKLTLSPNVSVLVSKT